MKAEARPVTLPQCGIALFEREGSVHVALGLVHPAVGVAPHSLGGGGSSEHLGSDLGLGLGLGSEHLGSDLSGGKGSGYG